MRSALFVALLLGFAGCTCNHSSSPSAANAEAGALATSSSAAVLPDKNAIFSAPISAAHAKDGAVFFAGFVAARNAFAITRIEKDGLVAWTVDAVADVRWSSDADVHVFASPDGGAYVAARGIRNKKFIREIAAITADGKLRAPAETMSSEACATTDGVASLHEDNGKSRATLRAFGGGPPHDLFSLRGEGEHEIVCAEHTVFAVTHDDAVTLERAGAPPLQLLAEHDTSDDTEEFTTGDTFGVVNVGAGALTVREANAQSATAWRALGKLPDGAELVSGDADASNLYVLYTEDVRDNSCPGGGSPAKLTAVHASRAGGDSHSHVLATLACDSDDGPFFTGFSHRDNISNFVVAWPERRGPNSSEPPISGLAYVVLSGDKVADVKRVALDADALVDAGCDEDVCYAAALACVSGTDGMVPGPARIVRYPQ
ncbi:MAG: hypothetical protein ABI183_06410 [Polyangiaceae bacterium]